jgi:thioredoxin-related protein
MKIYLILFCLIFTSFTIFGQNKEKCSELLNRPITATDLDENIDEFLLNLKTLILCEFDEIDYQIFMGPEGNMPIIGSFLFKFIDEIQNNKSYTFENLKETLLDIKNKPEYSQIKNIVEAQNAIIQKEASVINWESDKQLLTKMGLIDEQLNEIYTIVKDNENKPYTEIFLIYSDTLNVQKEKQFIQRQKKNDEFKDKNPESIELVKGLYAYDSYSKGLKKSKETNKPILLYFTGYACVNARKMEDNILSEYEIQDYINSNLVFVSLLVDNKQPLKENEIFYSDFFKKEVKTVGLKNLEIQITKFNSNAQPLFVLLDMDGNEIARIGYITDIKIFSDFLQTKK